MKATTEERETKQMRAVLEVVRAACGHLSADQVWARVRERVPRISRGTVYRNLQKLVRRGAIAAVHVGERAVRYDATIEPHDHFVCQRCGTIKDIPGAEGKADIPGLRKRGYLVRKRLVTWYGLCAACHRARARRTRGGVVAHPEAEEVV